MKSEFIESFAGLNKRFVYVILLDILFYVSLVVSFVVFSKLLVWSLGSLYDIPGRLAAMADMTDVGQLGSTALGAGKMLSAFKMKIFFSLIVFWFFIVLSFTLFKAAAWSFVSKNNINRRFCWYVFKFNLVWFGAFALLGIILFFVSKPAVTGIALIVLFLLLLYFTPLCYALFNPKKDLKWLSKRVWHVAVEKIYWFIVPFLLALLILICSSVVISGILIRFLLPSFVFYSSLFVFLVWQAWFKYYIFTVARRIK